LTKGSRGDIFISRKRIKGEYMKIAENLSGASLFPILPAPLSGLAKLAAEAEHADEGHLVEFRAIQARSILNRSVSKRLRWIEYSINPYRGCEFGCRYCYARYTHEFLAPKAVSPQSEGQSECLSQTMPHSALPANTTDFRDPEAFERVIFLKQNAAWLIEQELKRIDPERQIAMGTATDPYQPIERKARITRSLLEVFARQRGRRLGIVTKSTLIERDTDLLYEIARRNRLVVHITITTADAALARKLEPRAPRPDLRFATVRRLREAGIVTGILCSPLLPGITDSQKAIDGMARRAAAAGASFFAANPLFLKPCSRPTYFSFIREHFPELIAEYETRFATADFAAPSYSRKLATVVAQACRRHGIGQRSRDALSVRERGFDGEIGRQSTGGTQRKSPEGVAASGQQRLFG
jgi:DNA repair photolyase